MKPTELFGVAVRTIGLTLFVFALFATGFALLGLLLGGPGEVIGILWFGVPALLVGLWLLRGADAMVAFLPILRIGGTINNDAEAPLTERAARGTRSPQSLIPNP